MSLIDVVDFTSQAEKLGDKFTRQFTGYFQDKIKSMVEKRSFHVVKPLGDAVLIFGTDPEGIIDIMRDLFERDKPEDQYGFISRFRMVAHSGYFQLQMDRDTPVDTVSAQAIKVFRLEKNALAGELVVTHELYRGIKALLTGKNIDAARMLLDKPIKGFDNEEWFPPFFKLHIMKEYVGVSNLLERKMWELEEEVQTIPVFGKIYPPVPMDKNFINLSMLCDHDRIMDAGCVHPGEGDEEPADHLDPWSEKEGKVGNDEWIYRWSRKWETPSRFAEIDVNVLYDRYKQGIIFGLPGAGKTTILRHLAFKEFNPNKTKEENAKQVVLFVPCRNILFYDDWYKIRYGAEPNDTSWEDSLSFMTWVFLFGKKQETDLSPNQLKEFQSAYKRVKQAFVEERLTLLVDALDEAPDMKTKERIRQLFLSLTSSQGNRLYLTSRPSERVHLKQEKIPEFNVRSLTMEQVRNIARHLMHEDSPVFKAFDKAIWQEEMVVKIAATPMVALLVTAYFQAYGKFDHRFPMYDLLVKFILLNTWEIIKTHSFNYRNLELFFKEIKEPDFLEKNKQNKIVYDSLASLCFGLFFDSPDKKVQWTVNEETLLLHFSRFIEENLYYHEKERSEILANKWMAQFQRDHILIQVGPMEYMFVHSTVMEYLAAYYLVDHRRNQEDKFGPLLQKSLEREDYLELETVPIGTGSDMLTGFKILAILRDYSPSYPPDRRFDFGIKCLAELEWMTEKTLGYIQIESLKAPFQKVMKENHPFIDWLYIGLKERILFGDKEELKRVVDRYEQPLKLCRDTLLETYLDYTTFNTGDSELIELRIRLLEKLVQKEPLEKWLKTHSVEEKIDNVLRLDSQRYHAEDKNFKYYRELIGRDLIGFWGSPNMKHESLVMSCAFSPDGKTIISASKDYTLKLWNTKTGKEIRTFCGHTSYVFGCTFSPDGKWILSASNDKTLKLWDAETGKEIRTFTGHTAHVTCCAIYSNEKTILSASDDKTLKLWDTQTGKEIKTFTGHTDWVSYCTFSPDGNAILSASFDQTLKLWDIETGQEIRSFNGHNAHVSCCAFSHDGKIIISASSDKTLKLWDMKTGREIGIITGHLAPVTCCAFSVDGKFILSASDDKTLKLWNAQTGKEIRTFTGHTAHVTNCTFSPDGKTILSASWDGTLKMWDVETGKEIRSFNGHKNFVFGCSFSLDGKMILSASEDKTLKLWNVESGNEIRTLSGHMLGVARCAISHNRKTSLSASKDKTLKLWETETGKEIRTFKAHQSFVYDCVFSPDGKRVVSASDDSTLKLWDVETGNNIRTFIGHKEAVMSVVATPDGQRAVSASVDKTIKLWDLQTGNEIRTFNGHDYPVLSCAVTSDGRHVVSASKDNSLKLWDMETGYEISNFIGHSKAVRACVFSTDGKILLSSSLDKTIKLWDVETGQCLKTLQLPWIPMNISISPTEPTRVITANANGTLTMFDFEELSTR